MSPTNIASARRFKPNSNTASDPLGTICKAYRTSHLNNLDAAERFCAAIIPMLRWDAKTRQLIGITLTVSKAESHGGMLVRVEIQGKEHHLFVEYNLGNGNMESGVVKGNSIFSNETPSAVAAEINKLLLQFVK